MKQTRRKELKTNDLSFYLHQIQDWSQKNATYLLAGLAAVVLIIVIGLYVQHSRHKAMQDAWTSYKNVLTGNLTTNPQLLDQANSLAEQYGTNPDLGPQVLQLKGDLAYQKAMMLASPKDKAQRQELLRQARAAYAQELEHFDSRHDVRGRARMSMAAVDENLVIAGEGSIDSVRKLYQQVVDDVVDGRPSAYEGLAREKLSDLDKRLQKLQIIATRPAATAPATQTAPPAEAMPATTPAP